MAKVLFALLLALLVSSLVPVAGAAGRADRYNVLWDSPSRNSWGSMPIGNGDIGLNVWIEENGGLVFYISKTDAWSENCRLLKLGRVRLRLEPNPFAEGSPFKQELRLRDGEIAIEAGAGDRAVSLRVWVDANHPAIHVDAQSERPFRLRADLETWRTERRRLSDIEVFSAYGLHGDPTPVFVEPDVIVAGQEGRIVWYHRNERSIWADNLTLQGLGDLTNTMNDPLLHRTFGAAIKGQGLINAGETTLESTESGTGFEISIYPLTAQTDTAEKWLSRLDEQISRIDSFDKVYRLAAHRNWWHAFWARSWIDVSGSEDAEAVAGGYALQRFINACGGRGAQPIKFNGSIFTVDLAGPIGDKPAGLDADYRSWGGPFWWQNTRLPYWSMLSSGDFDLMEPLFRMYMDALPLAKARTRTYYNHDGAFYPETMYFWGTYTNENYGWDRTAMPDGLTQNRYIRYEWQGGIELVAIMLDYYALTRDEQFLKSTLLPFAGEILTFYNRHYPRDEDGRIRFEPAQALETYWDSVNPAPEIAGLGSVLDTLLELPDTITTDTQRVAWRAMQAELPPVPTRRVRDHTVLSPAGEIGPKHNSENPELYAIFPYRLFGVGKDRLDLARHTYRQRIHKGTGGWQQTAIQAAMLGLAGDAARMVTRNFKTKHDGSRFPAFWGPNFDWVPDQDHGSVTMIALQQMLMQTDGKKIIVFPAWPKDWDVEFKLHAPYNTTVEGAYRDGALEPLTVTPASRAEDVVRMEPR